MAQITHMAVHADATGTLELVCERSETGHPEPEVRAFFGGDQFGLLVDGLAPNEQVSVFFEVDSTERPDSDEIGPTST